MRPTIDDLDSELAEKIFENAAARIRRQPMVLVHQGKHRTNYYNAATVGDFEESCLVLLNDMTNAGYYDKLVKLTAQGCVVTQDYNMAWAILAARADYEYEGVSLEPLYGGSRY